MAIEVLTHGNVSPSYDEIGRHIGLKSKAGVARLVDSLVRQGRITREPHRARSLAIVPAPGADAQLRMLIARYGEHDVRLAFAAICAERDRAAMSEVAA